MPETETIPPPRRLSNVLTNVTLTGCLIPIYANGQAKTFGIPGSDDLYLAVFSTLQQLKSAFAELKLPNDYVKICEITHGPTFVAGVNEASTSVPVHIILNPYRHGEGKVRWTQIMRESDPLPPPVPG